MPSYKLTYFNIRARGELTRLLFNAAGVDFEDERIEFADWPKLKTQTVSGQLPFLTVDGEELCQSHAIERFLAKEFSLAGKGNWEQAQADMAVDLAEDMIKAVPLQEIVFGTDEEKKNELRQQYEKEKLPNFLATFEKVLTQRGTGFFAGNEMTWADLAVYQSIDWLQRKRVGMKVSLDNYPKLQALISRIEKSSKVSDYLAKRPESDL